MEFELNRDTLKTFLDEDNTHYEALGLKQSDDTAMIIKRLNLIDTPEPHPTKSREIKKRAKEIHACFRKEVFRAKYDRYLAAGARSNLREGLQDYLEVKLENDGVLDAEEEKDFYSLGKKKGFSTAELKTIFDKFIEEEDAPRKQPTPKPAPQSTTAPPAAPPATQQAPPKQPDPKNPKEAQIRWGTTAAVIATGVSALTCATLTHAMHPSFGLVVVAASLIWFIKALNDGVNWKQIVPALILASLAAAGNPVLGGLLSGVVGTVVVVMVVHWRQGSRGLAGSLSGILLVGCLGTGMFQGDDYLKPAVGQFIWPILEAQNNSLTPDYSPAASANLKKELSLNQRKARSEEGAASNQSKKQPVNKTPSKQNKTKTPVAKPRTAPTPVRINFNTNPSYADVLISGSLVGQTPFDYTLKPGRHTVTFRKTGYQDLKKTIKIPDAKLSSNKVSYELLPLPVRKIEGKWEGIFDDKPIHLVVTQVYQDGAFTGRGFILLKSGQQKFQMKGHYNLKTGKIEFTDQGSGMEFSGSMSSNEAKSMSGTSTFPGLNLNREWTINKVNSSVKK